MTRPELMLLKFKVQREPIIPARSWDKNPIVQHRDLVLLSAIDFLLLEGEKKKRKKKGRRIKEETQSFLSAQLAFNTHGSASRKETAGNLNPKT